MGKLTEVAQRAGVARTWVGSGVGNVGVARGSGTWALKPKTVSVHRRKDGSYEQGRVLAGGGLTDKGKLAAFSAGGAGAYGVARRRAKKKQVSKRVYRKPKSQNGLKLWEEQKGESLVTGRFKTYSGSLLATPKGAVKKSAFGVEHDVSKAIRIPNGSKQLKMAAYGNEKIKTMTGHLKRAETLKGAKK